VGDRRRLFVACLAVLLALAACSGDGADEGAGTTEPGGEASEGPTTTTTLDEGPFCTNVRALVDLGEDETAEPTPEAVVAQSEELLTVIGEITANVPSDSPPAVEALLDDFRVIAEAVGAAGGDVEAAYATLEAEQPELWARLAEPTAHDEGFAYFNERCGTPLP